MCAGVLHHHANLGHYNTALLVKNPSHTTCHPHSSRTEGWTGASQVCCRGQRDATLVHRHCGLVVTAMSSLLYSVDIFLRRTTDVI